MVKFFIIFNLKSLIRKFWWDVSIGENRYYEKEVEYKIF